MAEWGFTRVSVSPAPTSLLRPLVAAWVLALAVAPASAADPRMMPVDSLSVAPASDDALKALMTRRQTPQAGTGQPALRPIPSATMPAALAPLPGEAWFDPDSVNWVDADHADSLAAATSTSAVRSSGGVPGVDGNRFLTRIAERRAAEHAGSRLSSTSQGSGRLLERLLGERRTNRTEAEGADHRPDIPAHGGELADPHADPHAWPLPSQLVHEFEQLAARARGRAADVDAWSTAALDELEGVLQTAGPHDARACAALVTLGDAVEAGMGLAGSLADLSLAAETRRAALALARRVAVWRATAAVGAELAATPATETADTSRLLAALEGFETTRLPRDAAAAHVALAALASAQATSTPAVMKAVSDHYLGANVRIVVHHGLVSRLLPEASVSTGPLQDVILGRRVRGTKTVEQSTNVRFVPDPDRIHMELLVNGDVASRTVTESGPVTIHSRGAATFVVRKPILVSADGLAFGTALASASNQARLANIQTGFDSVPIMGQIVRNIARNQHDEARQEANREVNEKLVINARREVDAQVEPRFTEMATTIRGRVWDPLVRLGLDPTPVKLETTTSLASARLRLAGDGQFAAHTPRPRPPDEALLAVQFHESAVNNACERLGIAGRRLRLEEFVALLCDRLGIEPRQPDDLPEGVTVTFAAEQPVRIECRDGLMHVRVALDALESGRRNWYDIIAQVAYRPVRSGPQVSLEREGPVQLSGPGHQGRMEIGLRTVFGKIFVKERPIAILPAKLAAHPGLADVQAVQAVCIDGWFALALAESAPVAATPAAPPVAEQPSRRLLRR